MTDVLENIPAMPPLHFFALSVEALRQKETLLPDTSELLGEESFADVRIKWDEGGLSFRFDFKKPFEGAYYPDYSKGEAIEIFLDTRDMKTAGFPTKFCHHFLILPQKVGEIQALEISRFRTEDSHPICDPDQIFVESEFAKKSFRAKIGLPKEVLHGYDPKAAGRLGLTYRIHRMGGGAQHFAVSSRFAGIEQHPSTWATIVLKN